jgi:DNA-binding protein H-NS
MNVPAKLNTMSIDNLVTLRDEVDALINSRVVEERRSAQERLGMLDRLVGSGARAKGPGRGTRGVVPPKYRNPENPAETWAGRGLKPRWLAAALKSGGKLEDFSITAPVTKRGRPRKGAAK